MNFKKFFTWTCILGGILFIVLLISFFVNNSVKKCHKTDIYINETQKCYYFNETCRKDEEYGIINETNVCVYKPIGYEKYIIGSLIGLGSFVFIVLVIYIVSGKKGDYEYRRKEFVPAKRAIELIKEIIAEEYGIPTIKGKPIDTAFELQNQYRVFQKGDEWFVKAQIFVKDGTRPGAYTIAVNLMWGEDWIKKQMINWKEGIYEEFKITRGTPLFTPQDPKEKMLEVLKSTNPEKATELATQMFEKPSLQQEQVQPQIQPVYVPRIRRNTWRRY
jgi:hypothetical protein